MGVFEDYAGYYDLLYQEKDYATESKFIHELIQKHKHGAGTILELGCGTGAHAGNLARQDYEIHGVDLSRPMLKQAQKRLSEMPVNLASKLSFSEGDIRTVRLDRKFDVIISLFHVMSYQVTNQDIESAISTVKSHLNSAGIFIFDCWYGPAVLTDRPVVRIKRLENDTIRVIRIAEPKMHPNENIVDVNYTVFITDKSTGTVQQLSETHRMRYLFKPEIEAFLYKYGLQLIESIEWLTDRPLGFESWSGCFLARV